MTETKRKTHTSSAVKARYNAKVYTQIAFSAPKEMAAAFKEKCVREGVSQASILKQAMEDYLAK
jgi:hypothetical protein